MQAARNSELTKREPPHGSTRGPNSVRDAPGWSFPIQGPGQPPRPGAAIVYGNIDSSPRTRLGVDWHSICSQPVCTFIQAEEL